jgi:hypothetical protein
VCPLSPCLYLPFVSLYCHCRAHVLFYFSNQNTARVCGDALRFELEDCQLLLPIIEWLCDYACSMFNNHSVIDRSWLELAVRLQLSCLILEKKADTAGVPIM